MIKDLLSVITIVFVFFLLPANADVYIKKPSFSTNQCNKSKVYFRQHIGARLKDKGHMTGTKWATFYIKIVIVKINFCKRY